MPKKKKVSLRRKTTKANPRKKKNPARKHGPGRPRKANPRTRRKNPKMIEYEEVLGYDPSEYSDIEEFIFDIDKHIKSLSYFNRFKLYLEFLLKNPMKTFYHESNDIIKEFLQDKDLITWKYDRLANELDEDLYLNLNIDNLFDLDDIYRRYKSKIREVVQNRDVSYKIALFLKENNKDIYDIQEELEPYE